MAYVYLMLNRYVTGQVLPVDGVWRRCIDGGKSSLEAFQAFLKGRPLGPPLRLVPG